MKRHQLFFWALLSLAAPGCDKLPTTPTPQRAELVELIWKYGSAALPLDARQTFWDRHPYWLRWTRDGWWANPEDWPYPPVGFGEEEGRGGRTFLKGEMWFSLPKDHPTAVRLCFTASLVEGEPVWSFRALGHPQKTYNHLVEPGENEEEIEILNASGTRVQTILFEWAPSSLSPRPLEAPDPQVVFELENLRLEW